MDALTKAFLEWANRKGYDTAHAYNENKGRWMFLHPMTADLYEAWQASGARMVPEGYVVVPVEPTQKMMGFGAARHGLRLNLCMNDAAMIYEAMLAAAQEPKK